MTGYVTTCGGKRVALPPLLQWSVRLTDGDPCDSFSVEFPHSRDLTQTLYEAMRFTAEENGRTVFTGVVDDYTLRLDRRGLVAEMTGRGMAAVLLDNQVRAAEYVRAQLEDILNAYVRPYGITSIRACEMPPVERFVVETGYTCWQVLAGFCRHSAGVFPRFLADGTLVLEKEETGQRLRLGQTQCVRAAVTDERYGRCSQQVLVNTRTGQQTQALDREFIARGGSCVKVQGRTGNKIRATWRTAEQRVEDARRERWQAEIRVPGGFAAQPLDRVELALPEMGIEGVYTVRAAETECGADGLRCTLSLRE